MLEYTLQKETNQLADNKIISRIETGVPFLTRSVFICCNVISFHFIHGAVERNGYLTFVVLS